MMVGDRGMLTSARIEALKEVGGVGWISALRSIQIEALVNGGDLQLEPLRPAQSGRDLLPRFPGEGLVACKNPALAQDWARQLDESLPAQPPTESGRSIRGSLSCTARRSPPKGASTSTASATPSMEETDQESRVVDALYLEGSRVATSGWSVCTQRHRNRTLRTQPSSFLPRAPGGRLGDPGQLVGHPDGGRVQIAVELVVARVDRRSGQVG